MINIKSISTSQPKVYGCDVTVIFEDDVTKKEYVRILPFFNEPSSSELSVSVSMLQAETEIFVVKSAVFNILTKNPRFRSSRSAILELRNIDLQKKKLILENESLLSEKKSLEASIAVLSDSKKTN
jgi:hypothetical protein